MNQISSFIDQAWRSSCGRAGTSASAPDRDADCVSVPINIADVASIYCEKTEGALTRGPLQASELQRELRRRGLLRHRHPPVTLDDCEKQSSSQKSRCYRVLQVAANLRRRFEENVRKLVKQKQNPAYEESWRRVQEELESSLRDSVDLMTPVVSVPSEDIKTEEIQLKDELQESSCQDLEYTKAVNIIGEQRQELDRIGRQLRQSTNETEDLRNRNSRLSSMVDNIVLSNKGLLNQLKAQQLYYREEFTRLREECFTKVRIHYVETTRIQAENDWIREQYDLLHAENDRLRADNVRLQAEIPDRASTKRRFGVRKWVAAQVSAINDLVQNGILHRIDTTAYQVVDRDVTRKLGSNTSNKKRRYSATGGDILSSPVCQMDVDESETDAQTKREPTFTFIFNKESNAPYSPKMVLFCITLASFFLSAPQIGCVLKMIAESLSLTNFNLPCESTIKNWRRKLLPIFQQYRAALLYCLADEVIQVRCDETKKSDNVSVIAVGATLRFVNQESPDKTWTAEICLSGGFALTEQTGKGIADGVLCVFARLQRDVAMLVQANVLNGELIDGCKFSPERMSICRARCVMTDGCNVALLVAILLMRHISKKEIVDNPQRYLREIGHDEQYHDRLDEDDDKDDSDEETEGIESFGNTLTESVMDAQRPDDEEDEQPDSSPKNAKTTCFVCLAHVRNLMEKYAQQYGDDTYKDYIQFNPAQLPGTANRVSVDTVAIGHSLSKNYCGQHKYVKGKGRDIREFLVETYPTAPSIPLERTNCSRFDQDFKNAEAIFLNYDALYSFAVHIGNTGGGASGKKPSVLDSTCLQDLSLPHMKLLFRTKSILFNSLFAPLRALTDAKYDGNMELHEMGLLYDFLEAFLLLAVQDIDSHICKRWMQGEFETIFDCEITKQPGNATVKQKLSKWKSIRANVVVVSHDEQLSLKKQKFAREAMYKAPVDLEQEALMMALLQSMCHGVLHILYSGNVARWLSSKSGDLSISQWNIQKKKDLTGAPLTNIAAESMLSHYGRSSVEFPQLPGYVWAAMAEASFNRALDPLIPTTIAEKLVQVATNVPGCIQCEGIRDREVQAHLCFRRLQRTYHQQRHVLIKTLLQVIQYQDYMEDISTGSVTHFESILKRIGNAKQRQDVYTHMIRMYWCRYNHPKDNRVKSLVVEETVLQSMAIELIALYSAAPICKEPLENYLPSPTKSLGALAQYLGDEQIDFFNGYNDNVIYEAREIANSYLPLLSWSIKRFRPFNFMKAIPERLRLFRRGAVFDLVIEGQRKSYQCHGLLYSARRKENQYRVVYSLDGINFEPPLTNIDEDPRIMSMLAADILSTEILLSFHPDILPAVAL